MVIASATTLLAPLALLACPIGMGLMMWMMSRGNKQQEEPRESARPAQPPSIEVLREEQKRLDEEIERLERSEASEARRGGGNS